MFLKWNESSQEFGIGASSSSPYSDGGRGPPPGAPHPGHHQPPPGYGAPRPMDDYGRPPPMGQQAPPPQGRGGPPPQPGGGGGAAGNLSNSELGEMLLSIKDSLAAIQSNRERGGRPPVAGGPGGPPPGQYDRDPRLALFTCSSFLEASIFLRETVFF